VAYRNGRSSYRQASRRIAAEMAAAPGFAGLAEVVDRLTAGSARLSAPELNDSI
jgi:UDP:flavonoid glycosyltransferase YjiC (YdhE family)